MTDRKHFVQTIFPEFPEQDIETLLSAAVPCTFPLGVDICKEGDEGDCLYLIEDGWTDIIVHTGNGEDIVVDRIGPGYYFGEMALLGETTRSATIRTTTPCTMLKVSHADFEKVIITNPDLLRRLMRRIIGHLRRNDRAVIQELNAKNAELSTAYEELAEQEALRSQFIATLTHELRTPLTKMRGYMDLVKKGAMNEQMLPLALDSVDRNVDHMIGLTNDMFLLYEMNPQKLSFSQINVADLLVEALQITRDNMGDIETAVQLNIPPDLPQLVADRNTILLALRAIIGNAFKYDPARSPIVIEARHEQQTITISIQDEGVGIPGNEHEKIFDPFYRIEKEGGAHLFPGIGVGLTIAKHVIERHNGRIQITSTPDQGSTFTILLPAQS